MKKVWLLLTTLFMVCLLGNVSFASGALELSKTEIAFGEGEKAAITLSVVGESNKKNLEWRVEGDENVVVLPKSTSKVNKLKITAGSATAGHNAKIIVTDKESEEVVTCDVHMVKPNIVLEIDGKVYRTEDEIILAKGQALPLLIKYDIEEFSDAFYVIKKAPKLKSTNTKIVSVSSKALTGKGYGTADIAVTPYSLNFKVRVASETPITEINLSDSNLLMQKGAKKLLTVKINENGNKDNLVWSTSDKTIATVDKKGNVTARKEGIAKITVKANDGSKEPIQATCEVKVINALEGATIKLNVESIQVAEGYEGVLVAEVCDNTGNKIITKNKIAYKTQNKKIATIDKEGKIKGIAKGITKVTAYLSKLSKECDVTVGDYVFVESVELDKKELKVGYKKGKKEKLVAEIYPKEATNKSVKWETSDKGVAVVDKEGNVEVKGLGKCTITVTSLEKGEIMAALICEVVDPETIKEPEVDKVPEAEKVPEAVKTLEVEKAPEAEKEPEAEKVPEEGKAPEVEKIPEAVKTLEVVKAPEAVKGLKVMNEPKQEDEISELVNLTEFKKLKDEDKVDSEIIKSGEVLNLMVSIKTSTIKWNFKITEAKNNVVTYGTGKGTPFGKIDVADNLEVYDASGNTIKDMNFDEISSMMEKKDVYIIPFSSKDGANVLVVIAVEKENITQVKTYTLTVNPGENTYSQKPGTPKTVFAPEKEPSKKEYGVIYNYNGGTGTEKLAKATKTTTYTFKEWSLSGAGKINSGTSNPLTYTYGNGDGILTAEYISDTKTTSVILPTPTKAGYTFNGWMTIDRIIVGKAGENYTPEENITLYAKWATDSYAVTVNPTVGGSVNVEGKGEYNSTVSLTAIPSDGCEFTGWEVVSGGAKLSSATATTTFTMPANDVTIKANFELVKYKIEYNANGGSGVPNSQIKDHGEELSLSGEEPRRGGYIFLGWSTNSRATIAEYKAGEGFKKDEKTILYAVWKEDATQGKTYELTVKPGGEKYSQKIGTTIDVLAPENKKSYIVTYYNYEANEGQRSDSAITTYEFDKWDLEGKGEINDSKAKTVTYTYKEGDGILTAKYNYDVTPGSVTLPTPQKSVYGKTFKGWRTTDREIVGAAGDEYIPEGNINLYAVWDTSVYTIIYDAKDGSGAPDNQEKIHGQPLTLSSTVPTKIGYIFLGWKEMGKVYQGGGRFEGNKDTTFIAEWMKCEDHNYLNETCTNLGICERCGATSEEALGHDFESKWVEESGSYYKKCQRASCNERIRGYKVEYEVRGEIKKSEIIGGESESAYDINIGLEFDNVERWLGDDGKNYNKGEEYNVNKNIKFTAILRINVNVIHNIGVTEHKNTITKLAGEEVTITPISLKVTFDTDDGTISDKTQNVYPELDRWECDEYNEDNTLQNFVLQIPTSGDSDGKIEVKAYYEGYSVSELEEPKKTGYVFLGWYDEAGNKVEKICDNTTLYAKWDAIPTSISLRETQLSIKVDETKEITATVKPANATGKINWSSEDDSIASVENGVVTGKKAGKTIIAAQIGNLLPATCVVEVTPKMYIIKYDAGKGSRAPASQVKTDGENLILTTDKPEREGYTFKGWNTKNNSVAVEYDAGGKFIKNANTTLYAVWDINKYKITFDTNGGELGNIPSEVYKTHDEYLELSKDKPKKDGCRFRWWKDNQEKMYIEGTYYKKNEENTLTAEWDEEYEIYYWSNLSNADNKYEAGNINFDKKSTIKDIMFQNDGHKFVGWNTEMDGSGKSYSPGAQYIAKSDSEDLHLLLYAQWKEDEQLANYKITFDVNGGDLGDTPNEVYKTHDKDLELSKYIAKKDGCRFVVWQDKEGGKYNSKGRYKKNEENTLTAIWDEKHEIYYWSNLSNTDNKNDFDSILFGESTIIKNNEFQNNGHKFVGWNTKRDGSGKSYRPGEEYTADSNSGDLSLYAQWTIDTYTVTVQEEPVAGGSITGTGAYNYGTTVTLVAKPNTGYVFSSWEVVSGGITLGSTTALSTTFTVPANDVEIKAEFELEEKYTLTVKLDNGKVISETTIVPGESIEISVPERTNTIAGEMYTVTYMYNDKINTGESSQSEETVEKVMAGAMTKYTFDKWRLEGSGTINGGKADQAIYTGAAGSGTLIAEYKEETSPAVVQAPIPKRDAQTVDASLSTFSPYGLEATRRKIGFIFKGWYTAAIGGIKVIGGGEVFEPKGNITLHAQWEICANHKYIPATCESLKKCQYCGATSESALGHDFTGEWKKEDLGYYKECQRANCDEKIKGYKVEYEVEGKIEKSEIIGGESKNAYDTNIGLGFDNVERWADGDGNIYNKGEEYNVKKNIKFRAILKINVNVIHNIGVTEHKNTITKLAGEEVTITPISLKVTFDTDGGTISDTTQNVYPELDGWECDVDNSDNTLQNFVLQIPTSVDSNEIEVKANYKGYSVSELEKPKKTGYAFLGWYDEDGNKVEKICDNTTLYAKWDAIPTSISLRETQLSIKVDETKEITATVKPANATGKINWSSEDESIASVENGVVTGKKAGRTIIAAQIGNLPPATCVVEVTPKMYIIKYDAGKGSGAPASQVKTHGEDLILTTDKPEREGYTFKGWNTKNNSVAVEYDAGGKFIKNANTTLYAIWVANTYTVSCNVNDGSGKAENVTKTYEQPLTLPNSPTREGYKFLGWSIDSSAITAEYKAGGSFIKNENTILYAIWEKSKVSKLTINPNGGSVSVIGTGTITKAMEYTKEVGTIIKVKAEKIEDSEEILAVIKYNYNRGLGTEDVSEEIVKTRYPFEKWILEGGISIGNGTSNLVTYTYGASDGKLTAKYKKVTSVTLPKSPTREGYTFKGWYTAASGGTKIGNGGASYTPTENITLYAQWATNSYAVTVNPTVGGSVNVEGKVEYNSTVSLTAIPSDGYEFTGWEVVSGGAKLSSATATTTFTMPANKVEINANFEPLKYKITYNANGGTGEPLMQTKGHEKSLTLSSTKPTKAGYEFSGWAIDSSAEEVGYLAGASFEKNADTILYAVWKSKVYTISYNTNGGREVLANKKKIHGESLTLSSTVPTKIGHIFLGWEEMGKVYQSGGTFEENRDATFVAQWEECKHEGGYTYTPSDLKNEHKKVCKDCSKEETEGHYYKEETCGCEKCGYARNIQGAHHSWSLSEWNELKNTYKCINCQKTKEEPNTIEIVYEYYSFEEKRDCEETLDSIVSGYDYTNESYTVNLKGNPGDDLQGAYKFIGWKKKDGTIYRTKITISEEEMENEIHLEAEYTKDVNVINIWDAEGNEKANKESMLVADKQITLTAPKRYYEINCYYNNGSDESVQIQVERNFKTWTIAQEPYDNKILEGNEVTIEVESVWGINVARTYSNEVDISKLEKPKRDGYKFKGWFSSKDGGVEVNKITEKTVIVHAQWEECTCSRFTYTNKNANEHTRTCKDCNSSIDEAHNYGTALCTEEATCICGAKRAAIAHSYIFEIGTEEHTENCSNCTYNLTKKHDFSKNNICECGCKVMQINFEFGEQYGVPDDYFNTRCWHVWDGRTMEFTMEKTMKRIKKIEGYKFSGWGISPNESITKFYLDDIRKNGEIPDSVTIYIIWEKCNHDDCSEATCTSPAICKTCGATKGTALGHKYDYSNINLDAHRKICSVCEEETTEAHTYKPATCTEPAKCVCGAISGKAKGHNFSGSYVNSTSKNGHYRRCINTNCKATSSLEAHVYKIDNLSLSPRCEKCKATITGSKYIPVQVYME